MRSGSQILTICLRRKTLPFPYIIVVPVAPVVLPRKPAPTTALPPPTIAPALPISVEGLTEPSSAPLLPPTHLNFPGALVMLSKRCQLHPCLPRTPPSLPKNFSPQFWSLRFWSLPLLML